MSKRTPGEFALPETPTPGSLSSHDHGECMKKDCYCKTTPPKKKQDSPQKRNPFAAADAGRRLSFAESFSDEGMVSDTQSVALPSHCLDADHPTFGEEGKYPEYQCDTISAAKIVSCVDIETMTKRGEPDEMEGPFSNAPMIRVSDTPMGPIFTPGGVPSIPPSYPSSSSSRICKIERPIYNEIPDLPEDYHHFRNSIHQQFPKMREPSEIRRGGGSRRPKFKAKDDPRDQTDNTLLDFMYDVLQREHPKTSAHKPVKIDRELSMNMLIRMYHERRPEMNPRLITKWMIEEMRQLQKQGVIVVNSGESDTMVRIVAFEVSEPDLGKIIANPRMEGAYLAISKDGHLLDEECPSKNAALSVLRHYHINVSRDHFDNQHLHRHQLNERLCRDKQIFHSFKGEVSFDIYRSPLTEIYGVSQDLSVKLTHFGISSAIELFSQLKSESGRIHGQLMGILSNAQITGLAAKVEAAIQRAMFLSKHPNRGIAVRKNQIMVAPRKIQFVRVSSGIGRKKKRNHCLSIGSVYDFENERHWHWTAEPMPGYKQYTDYQRPDMSLAGAQGWALKDDSSLRSPSHIAVVRKIEPDVPAIRERISQGSGKTSEITAIEAIIKVMDREECDELEIIDFPRLFDDYYRQTFVPQMFGFESLFQMFEILANDPESKFKLSTTMSGETICIRT